MTRLALRGLAARKLRTSLTIVAVLLGVTMIAGTFVLTDTIQKAFDDIFSAQTKGADVVVSGREAIETEFSMPRPLDDSAAGGDQGACPTWSRWRGRSTTSPRWSARTARSSRPAGRRRSPRPTCRRRSPRSASPRAARRRARTRSRSTPPPPTRRTSSSATRSRSPRPRRSAPFKLVGLATIGQSTGLGGATFVVFDLPTAQTLFDKQGKVDFAFVAGRDGVSQTNLKREIASLLPPTAQVRTAQQEADKAGDDIREGLSFLTTGLLAFAFIAVLVGAFLIFNTFSITVAQRSRELALLRTLGATRRQVLNSVLLEALTIGLIGSVVGILAGLGFAKAINALFKALGIDLPTTSLVLESRTIIVCLLVGTLVTLAGALAPALRATRVAPVEALREATAPTRGRWARLTPWLAGLPHPRSAPGSSSRACWPRAATPRRSCSARPAAR